MNRTRLLSFAALAAAALSLQGCKNACENLASQICYCLPDDGTRAACNQEASDNEDVYPVSSSDNAYCQHLLDTNACDCNQLTTEQGKINCGLVYPTEADGGTSGQ